MNLFLRSFLTLILPEIPQSVNISPTLNKPLSFVFSLDSPVCFVRNEGSLNISVCQAQKRSESPDAINLTSQSQILLGLTCSLRSDLQGPPER